MRRVKVLGAEERNSAVSMHAAIPRTLLYALESQGIAGQAILSDIGLTIEELDLGEVRIAADLMERFWRLAVEESGDESLGVVFAENFRIGSLDGLGFAWATSETLLDALHRLARFFRVICTAGDVVLDADDDVVRVALRIPVEPGVAFAPSVDAALALFVKLCRLAVNEDFCPVHVALQREVPLNSRPFEEFFRCPLTYGADENSLTLTRALTEDQLPLSNPRLARANDGVVQDYLAAFEQEDLPGRIRAEIIELLPAGAPSQDTLAQRIHMSTRSLQRKLSATGTSFSELLENVRQELAVQYLCNSTKGVSDIAYLLGYTEPTNFARSFKRWTGHSPTEYLDQRRE